MDDYYLNQAGSGMGSFSGVRYQRGDGFFGRFISGTVLPIIKKVLPFLGKTALESGVGVMNDWSKGEELGKSLKRHFSEGANKVADAAEEKVKQLTGSGKRKRGKSVTVKRKIKKKKKVSKPRKKRAVDFL